jgi:hypothetical protein
MTYTSIDRILSKFQRDYGSEVENNDLIEWSGEALQAIGTTRYHEEAVALIEVANHQCPLPGGIHNIIQIARNNRWCKSTAQDTGLCPDDIMSTVVPPTTPGTNPPSTIQPPPGGCGCHEVPGSPVAIDCHGTPLYGWEGAYYRPYFDMRYEYDLYRTFVHGYGNFSPVHLATSSFRSNMVCTNVKDLQLGYNHERLEYYPVEGKVLRFNFLEGQIALAYNRQVVDNKTGYPMVPDTYSATTAITSYIIYKLSAREFYQGREGSKNKLDKAEADWQWYCRQAANDAHRLQNVDEYENLLQQRNYLIPRTHEYNNFFGRLGIPENRRFNDPNGYNHPYLAI